MKVGRWDVPTPLVVGGVAGVGILVLGQRLTGQATPPPTAPGADVATPGAGGGTGTSDLWGDAEVGQFPSFVPSVPSAGSSPGGDFGWWDSEAPPAAPPLINGTNPAPIADSPLSPVAPPAPTSPAVAPPTTGPTSAYLYASVRAGTYKLYRINWGKAVLAGSFTTGGFGAEVHTRVVTAVDGTGTTTLMIVDTGAHAGKILYAHAAGITIATRYR